jgi:hypothetical protein
MPNLLQDYYDRLTALNRQRGMTGNMQYGRALDASLAEGYFDAAMKNKAQSASLANQRRALDIQQQGMDMSNKALTHNMVMGWTGLGANLLGRGAEAYLGRQHKDEILGDKKAVQPMFEYGPLTPIDTQEGFMYDTPQIDQSYPGIELPPENQIPWGEWDFSTIA